MKRSLTRERAVELRKIGKEFHPEMSELARMAILYLDERDLAEQARKDCLKALGEASTRKNQLEQARVYHRGLEKNIANLESELTAARGILFAYTDNEATADPWWAVVCKSRMGENAIAAGPFFSRERGEQHMEARRHEYGKAAYVFCFSGHRSEHYKALRAALKPADATKPTVDAKRAGKESR